MTIITARTGQAGSGAGPAQAEAARRAASDPAAAAHVISAHDFKSVFRRHPAGVAVVTLAVGDDLAGFTATSVISVSADPPYLVFSLDSRSSSWPAVSRAETLVVNFLSERQEGVAARFATSGIDRFAAGGWRRLPTGEPVIEGAVWLRGRIDRRVPVGSSYLVTVLALEASAETDAPPLVYADRSYRRLR